MNNKIDINLTGVPQTLLLPLFGRATLSKESYSPLHDAKAVQLVESLNYDFDALAAIAGHISMFWMARAYHFDQAIKNFLQHHPKGVVVSLGAGLETAFHRVDNGQLTWVDLDLPEVIALRQKLLPPSQREHEIAKSVLDFSWMDDVKKLGDEFFFFAGGLFMYFTEEENKRIFTQMAHAFPGSELIFDTISSKGLYHANRMLKQSMRGAVLTWGVDEPDQLATWSPQIKIAAKIPFFSKIKSNYPFPLKQRLKMYLYDWFDKGCVAHLKFIP